MAQHRLAWREFLAAVVGCASLALPAGAITIDFSYSHREPHPEDLDGSRLIAITQVASAYYESLLPQPGPFPETPFTFDLRWEDLGSSTLGEYRFGVPFQTDRLALNSNIDWFFDPHPLDHSEFAFGGTGTSSNNWAGQTLFRDLTPGQRNDWFSGSPPAVLEAGFRGVAIEGGPADDKFDLFSTVLHEIGHALGVRTPIIGSRSEYAFPSELIGGLDVAARSADGDDGHLAARAALMCDGCGATSIRRLPSATDLLAIADRVNARAATLAPLPGQFDRVLTDLHRVDFIATQSGNAWEDALNWVGGRVPTGEQDIFVRHGGTAFRSLSGTLRIGTNLRFGRLIVSDNSFLSNAGAIYIGDNGAGEMTIASGGIVFSDSGSIAFSPTSAGAVTVTGAGSSWTNSGTLVVGRLASGDMTIEAGGRVFNTMASIGDNPGSSGRVTVTGDGSLWGNTGLLNVGASGTGTLTISNGGAVSNTDAFVGNASGSNGAVTVVFAGSTWTSDGALHVGAFGTGTLAVQAGASVFSGPGFVGSGNGSTGTASVIGGSSWQSSGELRIAGGGSGMLLIAGGTVSNTNGILGSGTSGAGTVTVDGIDSVWTNSGNLQVGHLGTGTLTIVDGGQVHVGGNLSINASSTVNLNGGTLRFDGYARDGTFNYDSGTIQLAGTRVIGTDAAIADLFGASPAIIGDKALAIEGTTGIETSLSVSGGALTSQGSITVGMSAEAALTIQDGGSVSGTQGTIGSATGSSGTVTVTGSGSTWTSSSSLLVSVFGTGILMIEDGGAVFSGGGTLGSRSAGGGTVIVDGAGSTWAVDGSLTVSARGSNALHILAGGAVSSGLSTVASQSGADGEVIVSGSGSTWTIDERLAIGGGIGRGGLINGGAGRLVIEPGATVSVAEGIVLFPDGLLELAGGTLATAAISFQAGASHAQFDWTGGTLHASLFSGDLSNPGGTLVPGSSAGIVPPGHWIGQLTVEGDYTQLPGGTLVIPVGDGSHSRLVVEGETSLTGHLLVEPLPGQPIPFWQELEIISSGDAITGAFTSEQSASIDHAFVMLDYGSFSTRMMIGLVGDMNTDGGLDTGDVAPFVLALTDPQAYQDQFGIDPARVGDVNQDGSFDTGDVAPFVQRLIGGGPPSVPEPGSLVLLGVGGVVLLRRPRRHPAPPASAPR